MDAKSLLRTRCRGGCPRTPAPNCPSWVCRKSLPPQTGTHGDLAWEEASSAQEEARSAPTPLPVSKAQGAYLPKPAGRVKSKGWLSEQQHLGLTAGETQAGLLFLGGRRHLRYFSLKILRNLPTWWRSFRWDPPAGQTQSERAAAIPPLTKHHLRF